MSEHEIHDVVATLLNRRGFLQGGAVALGATALADQAAAAIGPKRKVILIPQDAGDWNAPARVGCRDFCAMAGWEFQHIGNPVYSVENHVEQVNNAIAAKPDVIITSLESVGLVPAFEKAQAAGIALVAHKTLGKAKGVFGVGNGNPGSTSIDKRQNGSEQGILDYNKANGTNFTVDKFADDEFFDPNSSIQKWSAKLDQYGDDLIGMIAVGGPGPLVKAAEGHGIEKGKIVIGTFDARPDVLDLIEQGWVYWGIDQQFPSMGFYATAAAWLMLERGYPTKTIRTGGDLITKDNLAAVKARTDKWVALAKQYGDLK